MNKAKGSIFLLIAALIWGTAFVAQSVGLSNIGNFTFNAIRNYIGALTLLPVIFIMSKAKKEEKSVAKYGNKTLIIGGIACGCALAIASSFQQMGIAAGAEPGKAGFITALYIIFVPLVGLFTKKKPRATIWLAVLLAVIGMYLLCVKENFTLEMADVYLLCGAFSFTFHILTVDKFSPLVDCVKLSCIQFFVCGTLCMICMFLFEEPTLATIKLAAVPILYTGIMSSGVAYTLQVVGQKSTPPTLATLIMSLESVFAALAGWIILHQAMSLQELIGSALVFAGIIIAQVF
ncbi:MAG: DMT family transporter [Clostridia bacterium]|nr:DMT family transporter [Clostridia bacterium]